MSTLPLSPSLANRSFTSISKLQSLFTNESLAKRLLAALGLTIMWSNLPVWAGGLGLGFGQLGRVVTDASASDVGSTEGLEALISSGQARALGTLGTKLGSAVRLTSRLLHDWDIRRVLFWFIVMVMLCILGKSVFSLVIHSSLREMLPLQYCSTSPKTISH